MPLTTVTPIGKLHPNAKDTDHRSPETSDLYDVYTDTWLYKGLKPFLHTMKFLGIFHSKHYRETYDTRAPHKTLVALKVPQETSWRKPTVSQVYCIIVMSVVIFNALRSLYIFAEQTSFGPVLLSNIVSVTWYMLCAVNSICCFRVCNNANCFPQFCVLNEIIYSKDDEATLYNQYCKKRAVIYSIGCLVLVALNTIGVGYMLYETQLFTAFTTPFLPTADHYNVVVSFYLVIQLYLSVLWIFPAAFQSIICSILYTQFKTFNETLKNILQDSTEGLPSEFERLRKRYNRLCDLVESADEFLAPYNGCVVVQCLSGVCVLLYNIVSYEAVRNSALVVAVTMFWIVVDLVNIAILCLGGALVNGEAHAAVKYIYEFPVSNLSIDNSVQISLFVARLTTDQIGLTAMKLFVFDKPAILTIVGMILTYFVLAIQFSPALSSASSTSASNCTDLLSNATLQCITL